MENSYSPDIHSLDFVPERKSEFVRGMIVRGIFI